MADMKELLQIARDLGVNLSEDEAVMDAVMEDHAEYIGTGLRQVKPRS